jgi:hypothetical protein
VQIQYVVENSKSGPSESCVSKTSLKVLHTWNSQPYRRKVPSVITECCKQNVMALTDAADMSLYGPPAFTDASPQAAT